MKLSLDKPRVAVLQCNGCGQIFYPYGVKSLILPPSIKATCSFCGRNDEYILDRDIQKELVRKKLRLDTSLEEKLRSLEVEVQNLVNQFNMLKMLIENLSVSKLEEKIDISIEQAKNKLEKTIKAQLPKKPKSTKKKRTKKKAKE